MSPPRQAASLVSSAASRAPAFIRYLASSGPSFLAFVYGIAAHKVAEAHRLAAQDRSEPVAEVPDAPELVEDDSEAPAVQGELWLSEKLDELMAALPSTQREILRLRIVLGLSAEEVANVVGSTPGAVRVAQYRALIRLREDLLAMDTPSQGPDEKLTISLVENTVRTLTLAG